MDVTLHFSLQCKDSIKQSLKHFQYCRFGRSLGIQFFAILFHYNLNNNAEAITAQLFHEKDKKFATSKTL
jgi:hypothetical protein